MVKIFNSFFSVCRSNGGKSVFSGGRLTTIKLAIHVMQMSSAMDVPKIAISAICSVKWRIKYQ